MGRTRQTDPKSSCKSVMGGTSFLDLALGPFLDKHQKQVQEETRTPILTCPLSQPLAEGLRSCRNCVCEVKVVLAAL